MKLRVLVIKLVAVVAPLLMLAAVSGAQPALASGSTVVVANSPNPTDCGKYHTAQSTNLVDALNTHLSGTILVCPGVYHVIDMFVENAKNLTIRQAVVTKGIDSRPWILVSPDTGNGIFIFGSSNVTIDGLILDASANSRVDYVGLNFMHSTGSVRNTTLFGSGSTSDGISIYNVGGLKRLKVAVSHCEIRGFMGVGVRVQGLANAAISTSLIDARDNGRVSSAFGWGILFGDESDSQLSAGGSVSGTTLQNNYVGVAIFETSSVTVSNNILDKNRTGITVYSVGANRETNNNKIMKNTITGVPDNGVGVYITDDEDATQLPMLKTLVSGNTISAVHQNGAGFGVQFIAEAPNTKVMTGTVTGNTLTNFAPGNDISNPDGFAGLTIKGNHSVTQ